MIFLSSINHDNRNRNTDQVGIIPDNDLGPQIIILDNDLVSQISTVLNALRREAKIVIVTCSSIGEVAEMVKSDDNTHVMRIDRPMADFAVANGDNILIVSTVESTMKPTLALLESSAERLNKTVHFDLHCIADAWSYFTSSDHNAYLNTISTDLQSHENKYDLIVLAQASMAKVEALAVILPLVLKDKVTEALFTLICEAKAVAS